MTVTTPLALILLLALPLAFYIGFPRIPHRRQRDAASLILRLIILTCLILALAGVQVVRGADRLAVVFLVDMSDSVGVDSRPAQISYIRDALAAMRPDDQAAIIAFGADALVERPMSSVREFTAIRSTPVSGNTDLEEAIGLALALFPSDAAKRIVILSDGIQTVGDAEAAARRASATGVEISYVSLRRPPAPEVRLSDVRVPPAVNAGQEVDLSLTIDSDSETMAQVTVFADGALLHSENLLLRQGSNTYALTLTAGEPGFSDFRVQVTPAGGDSFVQNNQLSAFSRVVGPPRVLIVAQDDAEATYLSDALTALGLTVDITRPQSLPLGVAALQDYASIVLANVPASTLSSRRMDTLVTYVRELGGGMVFIGGPNTYAPGGYFETALEDALPVDMQIRDQQRLPQLTIAYVIDRSGSMLERGPSGVENIELAKEAIIRSINFLQPTDRAGVISFDVDGYWIANLQPVLNRTNLQNLVGTLRAAGGTDILAGMRLAAGAMRDDPSPRKHIILLTDGGANEDGLISLSQNLYEEYGVTTSVIAIGRNIPSFLRDMAERGGGNYHRVEVVESIPTIFTQEAVLATRAYILEEAFVPALSSSSPIMDGITSAPPLLGYVATTERQTAQTVLRGPAPYNDPILAQWQYGLGRVVAFTSDATARWAQNWVSWDDFARFWGQAIRWTIIEGVADSIETRVVMEGEQARVIVDARDEGGQFLNGLALEASIVDPGLGATRVPLRQVAPGQYEAVFNPGTEGAYFVGVFGGNDETTVSQTAGWVMSYSPEYAITNADDSLLARLAEMTGGGSVAEDPARAFAHTLQAEAALNPLAPLLILIALLLLPFDIAVRRLLITASDVRRLREAVFGRRLAYAGAEQQPRLASLMDAKARAEQRITAEIRAVRPDEPTATPSATVGALRSRRAERAAPKPADAPAPRPTAETPAAPKPATTAKRTDGEGSLASQLLKKRKDRGEG
ncbi:VWA domain-containing protein [Anaerolineae bacterium CFX9]|nr:VWA domain-containing protein [Anaerolineae bacterium CFX9]